MDLFPTWVPMLVGFALLVAIGTRYRKEDYAAPLTFFLVAVSALFSSSVGEHYWVGVQLNRCASGNAISCRMLGSIIRRRVNRSTSSMGNDISCRGCRLDPRECSAAVLRNLNCLVHPAP